MVYCYISPDDTLCKRSFEIGIVARIFEICNKQVGLSWTIASSILQSAAMITWPEESTGNFRRRMICRMPVNGMKTSQRESVEGNQTDHVIEYRQPDIVFLDKQQGQCHVQWHSGSWRCPHRRERKGKVGKVPGFKRACKCYCNALTVWGFGYNDEGTDLVMLVHFRVF